MGLFTVKMVIDGVEFVGRCNGQQLNELKDNVKADQGMGCHLVVSKVEVIDEGQDIYEAIADRKLTVPGSGDPSPSPSRHLNYLRSGYWTNPNFCMHCHQPSFLECDCAQHLDDPRQCTTCLQIDNNADMNWCSICGARCCCCGCLDTHWDREHCDEDWD